MSQKSANLGLTRQTASGSEISNFEKSESANSEFRFGISVKFWRRRVLREFIWRALIQMFRGLTGDLGHYRAGSGRIAPPDPLGSPLGVSPSLELGALANSEFRFGINVKFWPRRVLRDGFWRVLGPRCVAEIRDFGPDAPGRVGF